MNNHSYSLLPHFKHVQSFPKQKNHMNLETDEWLYCLRNFPTLYSKILSELNKHREETALLIGIVQYPTEIELPCPAKDIRQLKQMTTFSFLCATREADVININTCRVWWFCSRSVGMDELQGSKNAFIFHGTLKYHTDMHTILLSVISFELKRKNYRTIRCIHRCYKASRTFGVFFLSFMSAHVFPLFYTKFHLLIKQRTGLNNWKRIQLCLQI